MGYGTRAWKGLRVHEPPLQGWKRPHLYIQKALGAPAVVLTLGPLTCDLCLSPSTVVPDTEKEQEWTPVTGPLLALRQEDQLLVRRLSWHVLNGEGPRSGLGGGS